MAVKMPSSRIAPEFGDWLRRARLGIPLNLVEFAKACELNVGTVRDLELTRREEAAFSLEVFVRVAKGLNMDLAYVLHRAGFDVGAGGIKVSRLSAIEGALELFVEHEHTMRSAMAEAMAAVDRPNAREDVDRLISDLGRGLGALDLVIERLIREGFVASRREPEQEQGAARPWTEQDREFLRENPSLSNEDAARQLDRSPDAIRAQRIRLREGAAR